MRLGIFGGTFDPVHYGHLLLAESCREQLKLEQVWFLPAAVPPHKRAQELSPAHQRIEMLDLAVGGHQAFAVCRHEIERGGVNYTVDTLAELRQQDPTHELFFLLGADSLRDLPTWKEPQRICRLATLVVVDRSSASAQRTSDLEPLRQILEPDQIDAIAAHRVNMPRIDLSSSDIRARVLAGRSIRFRTPRAVEEYIAAAGLYRAT